MSQIQNPVIRGFNPDPSIVRVGDDYYIATSTFEWFPGVQIHHSRDLVHWHLIGHALTRRSQLDLRGITDSGGVWAPSMSYYDGQFWLVYTNVRGRLTNFKDVGIYVSTAPAILGPWSDPIPLNSIGFDPSLFHDDDGRKWLVNMMWDFRKGHSRFAGIVLQEYDHEKGQLVGPMQNILAKPVLTEGPNIYKVNGTYYLMLAEGGTGWNHGISMGRAKSIGGPYELDPCEAVITTRDAPSHPLQKAGHGELVQTQSGEWYLAHLCSRPVGKERRCILGREVAIQQMRWSDDGWLRLAAGGHHPYVTAPAPEGLPERPWPAPGLEDHFDDEVLDVNWSALRNPIEEDWASVRERPGWLRLRGRESQHSFFYQSLIGRRLDSVNCMAETCMEFEPSHFTQMAGLIAWYDTRAHYYLRVTFKETEGKVLGIVLTDDGSYDELEESQMVIADWRRVWLRVRIDGERLQFSASPDGLSWIPVGPELDATHLSDDYGQGLHFTGAFFGLCAQDLGGTGAIADFDYWRMTY
jgi:xylan 1,4-beta-xylosidase